MIMYLHRMNRERPISLQYDLFTGELVDARTAKQKQRDERPHLEQQQMFSTRDIVQFGVNPHPLLPISETTRLGLELIDRRTDEEKEHDLQLQAQDQNLKLIDLEEELIVQNTPDMVFLERVTPENIDIDEDWIMFTTGVIFKYQFPLV